MIFKVDWRIKNFQSIVSCNLSILTSDVQCYMGSTEIISEKAFDLGCAVDLKTKKPLNDFVLKSFRVKFSHGFRISLSKKAFWPRMCSVVWEPLKCILLKAFELGSAVNSKTNKPLNFVVLMSFFVRAFIKFSHGFQVSSVKYEIFTWKNGILRDIFHF